MNNYSKHKIYRKFVWAIAIITSFIFWCLKISDNCMKIEEDEEWIDGNCEGMDEEVVC